MEAGDRFDHYKQNSGQKRPLQSVRGSVMVAVVVQLIPLTLFYLLKSRHFSEVEARDLHGGHHHVKSFFAGGPDGRRKRFHVVEQLDDALIEAEVPQAPADTAVLDQESSIARHAGHDFFVGIYFADVPEPRDENAALGGGN